MRYSISYSSLGETFERSRLSCFDLSSAILSTPRFCQLTWKTVCNHFRSMSECKCSSPIARLAYNQQRLRFKSGCCNQNRDAAAYLQVETTALHLSAPAIKVRSGGTELGASREVVIYLVWLITSRSSVRIRPGATNLWRVLRYLCASSAAMQKVMAPAIHVSSQNDRDGMRSSHAFGLLSR